MHPEDFFEDEADPFGPLGPLQAAGGRRFRIEFVDGLRLRASAEVEDLQAAIALADLVRDELVRYGTSGGEDLSDLQMRSCLSTLRVLTKRVGLDEFTVPFRDLAGFRTYWNGNGGYGDYSARRAMIAEWFDPLHIQLARLEERAVVSELAEPASPLSRTGWAAVDREIDDLRRHFRSALTPRDYSNVGNDCAAILESLSRQMYDPGLHLRPGETEPPAGETKNRIDRFIEAAAAGSGNGELRKLARDCIVFAQLVQHRPAPSRRDAGIAADAVILLANVLRRLADER